MNDRKDVVLLCETIYQRQPCQTYHLDTYLGHSQGQNDEQAKKMKHLIFLLSTVYIFGEGGS